MMFRLRKLLIVCICVATEHCLVQCCLRSGPSYEDMMFLKEEVQSIKRELHNLESKHEHFVSESRSRSAGTSVTAGIDSDIDSIIARLDGLEKSQSKLEKETGVSDTTKQIIKKTMENMEKQIYDKIEKLNNVLTKMDDKLKKSHGTLEESILSLQASSKEKFNEIRKVLKENSKEKEEMHGFVLNSLEELSSVVNSDLKTKVADFDEHITSIRTSKDEADKLLIELQTVVDMIRPNTFNKERAVMAFLFVVVFVLLLASWVFKLQQSLTELKKYS